MLEVRLSSMAKAVESKLVGSVSSHPSHVAGRGTARRSKESGCPREGGDGDEVLMTSRPQALAASLDKESSP